MYIYGKHIPFTYKMYLLFLLYLLQQARSYNCYYPKQFQFLRVLVCICKMRLLFSSCLLQQALFCIYKCILKTHFVAANDQTKHRLHYFIQSSRLQIIKSIKTPRIWNPFLYIKFFDLVITWMGMALIIPIWQ